MEKILLHIKYITFPVRIFKFKHNSNHVKNYRRSDFAAWKYILNSGRYIYKLKIYVKGC